MVWKLAKLVAAYPFSLAVVPQDRVFFQGTIRSNIDPLSAYSDAEIWNVLDPIRMRERVLEAGRRSGIGGQRPDLAVSGRGGEFSCGERQLLSVGPGSPELGGGGDTRRSDRLGRPPN